MRHCTNCGRTPEEAYFRPDKRARDGLRARCRECTTTGIPRGRVPVHPLDRAVETLSGCWLWQGPKVKGYGVMRRNGRSYVTHRWVYEQFIADIPDGLELDHLCRQRDCINPWHLDPVTSSVNTQRAWDAKRGVDSCA